MAYIVNTNYKFGLDSRRSELSSVPGTLLQAQDGHITQGAEFEKRKAFIQLNNAARPSNTFGLEVTSTGLVIFGSAAPTGALVASTTLYNIAGYAGVYYQQLIHPSSLWGNATPPAMTALLCSTSFGGNTWAAAEFADDFVYLYYNGTPIPGSYNGTVLTGAAGLSAIATQLSTFIATLSGFSVGAVTSSGSNYYFDMWSTAGLAYTLVLNTTSTNTGTGTLKATNISTFVTGVTGESATTTFSITGGSFFKGASTSGITSVQVYNQATSAWVEILGTAVYFQASDTTSDFADNIAAQIANYNSTLLVTAIATNNSVQLSFDISQGAVPNGDNVKMTLIGDCCVDNTDFNFSGNTSLSGGTTCTSVQVPNQTNIIPNGAAYSGSGTYVLSSHFTFVNGASYYWTPGANDISITVGTTTLTTAGYFQFATGNVVTLTGINSVSISGNVLAFIEILGATITSSTSVAGWVTLIATGIQTYCLAHSLSFTAYASNQDLIISRLTPNSQLPFGGQAFIVVSAGVVVDGSGQNPTSAPPIALTIAPNPVAISNTLPGKTLGGQTNPPVAGTYTTTLTASVNGGTAPFNFSWEPTTVNTGTSRVTLKLAIPSNIQLANQITLSAIVDSSNNLTFTQLLTCTVTDAKGLTAVATAEVIIPY